MAELVRNESDTDHRYRITSTPRGYLVSCSQKGETGLMLGPSEWLYRTQEAAEKGLDFVMLMNAWWMAMMRGYPAGDLPGRCEAAAQDHQRVVERLNDQPLIGREVKELRENEEGLSE